MLRRFLSILLLAVFVLPFFAPALASGQGAEAGLPACCRREGAHHCAMSAAERDRRTASSKAPQWKAPAERCPFCPASFATWNHHDTSATPPAQAILADLQRPAAGSAQTKCKRRNARHRARQTRGPPVVSLA